MAFTNQLAQFLQYPLHQSGHRSYWARGSCCPGFCVNAVQRLPLDSPHCPRHSEPQNCLRKAWPNEIRRRTNENGPLSFFAAQDDPAGARRESTSRPRKQPHVFVVAYDGTSELRSNTGGHARIERFHQEARRMITKARTEHEIRAYHVRITRARPRTLRSL